MSYTGKPVSKHSKTKRRQATLGDTLLIPTFGRLKQEDLFEFEDSLDYKETLSKKEWGNWGWGEGRNSLVEHLPSVQKSLGCVTKI